MWQGKALLKGIIGLNKMGISKKNREELLLKKFIEMKAFDEFYTSSKTILAGVDEVGRGPLAGPVVAAAVVLPKDYKILGIDDSKKLSEKKRLILYDDIIQKAQAYGIGRVGPDIIDEINILEATKLAMKEAVSKANTMIFDKFGIEIDHVLVDGLEVNAVDVEHTSIVKGDSKSLSIAAASIVAKVTRDREMIEYSKIFPGYGFENNKGYGTKLHYEGLRENGITSIHRKSFLKNFYNKY